MAKKAAKKTAANAGSKAVAGKRAAAKATSKKVAASPKRALKKKAAAADNSRKGKAAATAPTSKKSAASTAAKKKSATSSRASRTSKPSTASTTTTGTNTSVSSAAKKTATKKAAATTAAAEKPAAKKAAAKKTAAKKSGSSMTPLAGSLLSNDVPDSVPIPSPKGTTKDGIAYTKDFDVKFLRTQRDELQDRRARELARATRLEDEAVSLIEDGEMGDVQFDDEGGEGDTMVVQRDLDRLLSSQSRQSIDEIDAALIRIAEGTYGYSEVSGQPIPRERLEALPETTVLAVEKVGGAARR